MSTEGAPIRFDAVHKGLELTRAEISALNHLARAVDPETGWARMIGAAVVGKNVPAETQAVLEKMDIAHLRGAIITGEETVITPGNEDYETVIRNGVVIDNSTVEGTYLTSNTFVRNSRLKNCTVMHPEEPREKGKLRNTILDGALLKDTDVESSTIRNTTGSASVVVDSTAENARLGKAALYRSSAKKAVVVRASLYDSVARTSTVMDIAHTNQVIDHDIVDPRRTVRALTRK